MKADALRHSPTYSKLLHVLLAGEKIGRLLSVVEQCLCGESYIPLKEPKGSERRNRLLTTFVK